ncbi:hypothetical protein [Bradyrhizobium cenepequi]
MKYFLCKLVPPRPIFPQDMTPREAEIMQAHTACCGDDTDPQTIVAKDPVMKADAGFTYQVVPMLRAATKETY